MCCESLQTEPAVLCAQEDSSTLSWCSWSMPELTATTATRGEAHRIPCKGTPIDDCHMGEQKLGRTERARFGGKSLLQEQKQHLGGRTTSAVMQCCEYCTGTSQK